MRIALELVEAIPNRKSFDKETTVSRDDLKEFIGGLFGNPQRMLQVVRQFMRDLPKTGKGSDWFKVASNFAHWLAQRNRGKLEPHWPVMVRGNPTKLGRSSAAGRDIWSFSVLPAITCPGASGCLKFCYSYKAWGRPRPFFRQVGNTILLQNHPEIIKEKFFLLPYGSYFRPYVDGDFSSVQDVSFWMDCLRERPDIQAWGYSKSWSELLEYNRIGVFPANYTLNLSEGGNRPDLLSQIMKLPIVRDRFIPLEVRYHGRNGSHKVTNAVKHSDPVYRRALKEAAHKAGYTHYFPCPGECWDCSSKGPVCANRDAALPVLIDVH